MQLHPSFSPLPFRLFVSDLDDTLLAEDSRMSERTTNALRRLMRRGIPVVLASGRSAASVRQYVRKIDSPYPYIGANGAEILDGRTDAVLHADRVPCRLAREALAWLEARGVYAQLYHGDDWFYERRSPIADEYAKNTGITGTEAGMPLSAFIQKDTPKILGVDHQARIPALIAEMKAAFGGALSVTTSKPHFMEITSPAANKGEAARRVAEMLGVSAAETACAGDSLNDLPMLRWAGLPITVSNAREEVKRVCARIAGDGRRDGIADLLEELIPEENP